ncbi:MAG: metal-sensitive transcriptional regulator [Spirochaetales bacterium]|nr:metal-sensitive transcriptional regulator [Spirochaetales bacterium]
MQTDTKTAEIKAKKGPHPINQRAVRRLKNIEGQVQGIMRMVEEEKYCVDILTQVSAVRAALNSVGMLILRRHIETCVTNAIKAGGEGKTEIIDELMGILSKARL